MFNRLNGKRYHGAATQKTASPAEGFTPAHEENVRFVYEGERRRRISTGVDVGHSARSDLQGLILKLVEIGDLSLKLTRSEVVRIETGTLWWEDNLLLSLFFSLSSCTVARERWWRAVGSQFDPF